MLDHRDLIPVRPKHYRAIVLRTLDAFPDAQILVERRPYDDLSERGKITQNSMRNMINFEMRVGDRPLLGFHDHPDEMWIAGKFRDHALKLQDEGHLRIERPEFVRPRARRRTPIGLIAVLTLAVISLLMLVF